MAGLRIHAASHSPLWQAVEVLCVRPECFLRRQVVVITTESVQHGPIAPGTAASFVGADSAHWPKPAHQRGFEGRGIEYEVDGLVFSSNFCSANLARVERAEGNEFRLWTRKDCEGTDFETT